MTFQNTVTRQENYGKGKVILISEVMGSRC